MEVEFRRTKNTTLELEKQSVKSLPLCLITLAIDFEFPPLQVKGQTLHNGSMDRQNIYKAYTALNCQLS